MARGQKVKGKKGESMKNDKEEIDKCVNRLLKMYEKIEPHILHTKALELGGSIDKVTDWIHNVYYKNLATDFPQVSTSPNESQNEKEESSEEEFEPASALDPLLQQGLFSSFGEKSIAKKTNGKNGHPNGQENPAKKAKLEKGHPKAANKDPQPSTVNGTAQQNGQEKLAKKAKWEKSHTKAPNNDPLPSTSKGTAHQNDQEKLVKKVNWEKGQPKAANNDTQPSTTSEFGGNLDKVTDWIDKNLDNDFPKVSTSPNESQNEEENSEEEIEPEKLEIRTKWIRSHHKAANNNPQTSTSNGATPKNCKKFITEKAITENAIIEKAIAEYEKAILKKAQQEKSQPKAANDNPQPSTSSDTTPKNVKMVTAGKAKVKEHLNDEANVEEILETCENELSELKRKRKLLRAKRKKVKKEVSTIGCKTENAGRNIKIINLDSQISVSVAMDYTEPKPSLAQLEKLSKLQEEMSKRYLLNLENQISVEKRPIGENTTAKKDKWKKGHPIPENNDLLPSKSSDITQRLMLLSGTIQQIEPKPLLLESPKLPGSNSERSTDLKG
jgi:hypothetical protein